MYYVVSILSIATHLSTERDEECKIKLSLLLFNFNLSFTTVQSATEIIHSDNNNSQNTTKTIISSQYN